MSDLYIENFFRPEPNLKTIDATAPHALAEMSEESISQVHLYLRILKEEISKNLKEMPPFPLLLKQLEETLFSQDNTYTLELLDRLEELLDIKYLPTVNKNSDPL